MQRGQTPMFAREIIYTPFFCLQKRSQVGSINEARKTIPFIKITMQTENYRRSVGGT
jgi:hypothetical protein